MDSKIRSEHADVQQFLAEDDPTGELPLLDAGVTAGQLAGPVADDSVVDPNVLALRRVDAEVRRLMESWVELESQLNGRDSEIHRLRDWAGGLEEDLRATRHELAAARSDCERLRGEAIDQRAEVESQRRQAEARSAEAEGLRTELAAAQGRLHDLTAEVRLGRERTEHLTSRLAEHRDALAGMAARLGQAEKSSQGLDGEKAELAARIADAEQRCADLASRFRDAEAARRQVEKDVPAAERRAKELEGEVAKLRESAATMERKLEAASHDHDQARTSLQAQISDLETALGAARRDAQATGMVKLAELQAELDAERAVATDLRQRISDLEADRAQLLARLQELRDQTAAVDSEFHVKRKAIAALGNEIDRLGLIQANVRKLDSMLSQQISNKVPEPSTAEIPRNDRLIVWLDGARAMKFPLYKRDMVIGRSSNSDIRVTGRRTSRRHAHIVIEDGAVIIEDLGSLNGITVNDESVRRQRLHDGDVLDVGGARLRYVDLDERAAAHGSEVQATN